VLFPAPKNIRTAIVDPIPDPYTGKAVTPVTPIPVVYLEGVELSFAKD
jgi:hypothetical protein